MRFKVGDRVRRVGRDEDHLGVVRQVVLPGAMPTIGRSRWASLDPWLDVTSYVVRGQNETWYWLTFDELQPSVEPHGRDMEVARLRAQVEMLRRRIKQLVGTSGKQLEVFE